MGSIGKALLIGVLALGAGLAAVWFFAPRKELTSAEEAGAVKSPEAVQEMRILKIGEAWIVALPGNPSTGYTWRLDAALSEHLELVAIEDLGHAPPAPAADPSAPPIVGAPQEQRFRITGKAAGIAKVAFEHVRPWEGEPVGRQLVLVDVHGP